jgi:hypothetical protein
MTSIAYSAVNIQISARSVPTPPRWFGELTLIVHHLRRQGVLAAIEEQVRLARRRFGHYDVIDFVALLFGYAISGERTLEAFYEQVQPWASAFMALFGRDRLPARCTLSRFLAALDQSAEGTLRTLFLDDLLARPLTTEQHPEGLSDRHGKHFLVFDVDGTREAARQRALPHTDEDRPAPVRRLRPLCAPGYTGRKRGEVVRTRTTVLQAHTHEWLASFGNAGNGQYRVELRQALACIQRYVQSAHLPTSCALVRLDGQYGTKAVLCDLTAFGYLTRGKDYRLLDQAAIQARLTLPADQQLTHPESGIVRTLYDCPDQPLDKSGEKRFRVIVATHPAGATKSRIGVTRDGVVYELFLTNLSPTAFTAADVVALYLHRGSFEPTLADEDQEQDPDRWCSQTAWGQEAWQIISQWVWNVRLELGHHLHPDPVRTTEFAPALQPTTPASPVPQGYGPACPSLPWKAGHFCGSDFPLQPDGTLRCPAGQVLTLQERRREASGTLRLVYGASIQSCRPCSLREQCQWEGHATKKPRQVSLLLHPLVIGPHPILWHDWSRRVYRRACIQLVRSQRLDVEIPPSFAPPPDPLPTTHSRAQRAHYRLTFPERLARNARPPTAGQVRLTLFGVPDSLAAFLACQSA